MIADSTYALKLVARTTQGEIIQAYSFVVVNNFEVLHPYTGEAFRYGDMVDVYGTLLGNIKSVSVLQKAQTCYPSSSCYSTEGVTILKQSATNEVFATINSSVLKSDTRYVVKITVEYWNKPNVTQDMTDIIFDRRIKQGWPISLPHVSWDQASSLVPSMSDLDNDGKKEIIVMMGGDGYSVLPELFVFDSNGTLRWSKEVGGYPLLPRTIPTAISDIDNDGFKEILAVNYKGVGTTGELYAFNHDGSVLWVASTPGSGDSVAVGDINGDGNKEITLASDTCVTVVSNLGEVMHFWWLPTREIFIISGLEFYHSIGDIDNDNQSEIICGFTSCPNGCPTDNHTISIAAYKLNGAMVPGWPLNFSTLGLTGIHSTIGDINNDGKNEVMFTVPSYGILAVTGNATVLPGWPPFDPGSGQITLADFNNDKYLEVITGDSSIYVIDHTGKLLLSVPDDYGRYAYVLAAKMSVPALLKNSRTQNSICSWQSCEVKAWNMSGSLLPELSLFIEPEIHLGPSIGDVDNNGKIDLVVASSGRAKLYLFELNATYDPSKLFWPTPRQNNERTGCYNCEPTAACSDGTLYGRCSATITKYCENGNLVDKCSKCSCQPNYACNVSTELCYYSPANHPPLTPVTFLSSSSGQNTIHEDLICSFEINDPDNDLLDVEVNWMRNHIQ
jgi:hypothetical protein